MPVLLSGLKTLRKRRGYTQEELARRANISVATVSKHEQGVITGIDGETLGALSRALECERHELFLPDNSEITEKEVRV